MLGDTDSLGPVHSFIKPQYAVNLCCSRDDYGTRDETRLEFGPSYLRASALGLLSVSPLLSMWLANIAQKSGNWILQECWMLKENNAISV